LIDEYHKTNITQVNIGTTIDGYFYLSFLYHKHPNQPYGVIPVVENLSYTILENIGIKIDTL